MASTTKFSTWVGLIVTIGIVCAGVYWFISWQEQVTVDYVRLAEAGRIIQGEIVKFAPYETGTTTAHGRTRITHRAIMVVIEYVNDQTKTKKIDEEWAYDLKDRYKKGDYVDLLYLEENRHVKAASRNSSFLPGTVNWGE